MSPSPLPLRHGRPRDPVPTPSCCSIHHIDSFSDFESESPDPAGPPLHSRPPSRSGGHRPDPPLPHHGVRRVVIRASAATQRAVDLARRRPVIWSETSPAPDPATNKPYSASSVVVWCASSPSFQGSEHHFLLPIWTATDHGSTARR